ncbi:MAG: KTSC domain-containing protein [bacterium]
MIRKSVSSSNILSVGYDRETSILEVKFHSGHLYQYVNVPESVYHALMSASSKGSYLHAHIKDRYRCRQVG